MALYLEKAEVCLEKWLLVLQPVGNYEVVETKVSKMTYISIYNCNTGNECV